MKVRSHPELMREQANAALRISGAHHSSWNGYLRETTGRDGDVRGVAGWDHTIAYNRATVSEPLQEMFQYAGHYNQDPKTLKSYREAVKTVLHENVHMLAGEGRQHAQAQHAFANAPGVKQAEEGFTELYSQQQLNVYIDDLGLEEIAPGIKDADAAVAYKKYLPAAQNVADAIGRDSGLGRDEVVRRMATVTADQKFRAAAEMIYDSSDLPGLVPSEQRDAAVRRIATAIGPEFAKVENLSTSDPDRLRRESALVGSRTMDAARGAVRQLRQEWSMPAPEQQLQRGVGAEQSQQAQHQGQVRLQTRGPQESATGPREPGQGQDRGGRPAAALPPDLAAAARAGLGGSMPLSSATRLSADQQGSRRTTTTPGQDRQVPSHDR
jgi:hypothetical protein